MMSRLLSIHQSSCGTDIPVRGPPGQECPGHRTSKHPRSSDRPTLRICLPGLKAPRLAVAANRERVTLAVRGDGEFDAFALAFFVLDVGDVLRFRVFLCACEQIAMHLIDRLNLRRAA